MNLYGILNSCWWNFGKSRQLFREANSTYMCVAKEEMEKMMLKEGIRQINKRTSWLVYRFSAKNFVNFEIPETWAYRATINKETIRFADKTLRCCRHLELCWFVEKSIPVSVIVASKLSNLSGFIVNGIRIVHSISCNLDVNVVGACFSWVLLSDYRKPIRRVDDPLSYPSNPLGFSICRSTLYASVLLACSIRSNALEIKSRVFFFSSEREKAVMLHSIDDSSISFCE